MLAYYPVYKIKGKKGYYESIIQSGFLYRNLIS